ncbi:hypothetical protein Tco_1363451 [Tanacetum coccineum]
MSLAACVYLIWQERNLRICRDEKRSYKELAEVFSEIIRMRVLSLKVKSTRVVLNVQRRLMEVRILGNLEKLLDLIVGGYLYLNVLWIVICSIIVCSSCLSVICYLFSCHAIMTAEAGGSGNNIVLINNLDASNPLHIQTIDNDLYMGLVYSENAASVCELEDALTKFPKCIYEVKCSCDASKELVLHQQLMKLMQFSMGLDDCYQPIKSALLTRDLLLEVKDAYTTVSREESYIDVPESSSVNESKLNATFLLPNLLTIIEGTLTIIIQLEVMWPVLAIGVQILI